MKSFLLVALLAVAAAASVITNEAPQELELDGVPEGLDTPQELQVADADEVVMSELAVIMRILRLGDEEMPFVAPRRGLSLGSILPGDRILSRSTHSRNAVANTVLTQDVRYQGTNAIIVLAVRVNVVGASQGATASVVDGALGRNFITIRLQSARGRGFNYIVEIWGR